VRELPLVLAAILSAALLSAPTHAERGSTPGILRARDLAPFGLQRLDIRPSDKSDRYIGEWTVEVQAAYQNTFALSDDVRGYLERRDAGRIPLRAEDAHALLNGNQDSYYVDVEVGVVDLIVQRALTRQLGVFFELPHFHYGEGKLDSPIESFHDALGLEQMGRELVARDRFQMVYQFGDARLQMLDREVRGGFGDPIAGVRYTPSLPNSPWRFGIEAAAKLPVAGERLLLSTGETDFGIQASTRRSFGRTTLQANASAVYYSGGVESPADEIIPTLILACSYSVTPGTSIIVQSYASRSAVRDTTIDGLKDNKYQLSLGLQSGFDDWTWTFAVTENIVNFDNTPDVGFQLGLSYTGRPRVRSPSDRLGERIPPPLPYR
jgi:hypothetical protein